MEAPDVVRAPARAGSARIVEGAAPGATPPPAAETEMGFALLERTGATGAARSPPPPAAEVEMGRAPSERTDATGAAPPAAGALSERVSCSELSQ